MKGLIKRLLNFSKKHWALLSLFLLSLIFFYPVWLQGKDALPTDALVGAHTPWIEVQWEGYPAGVPIKNQEITDAISQFYPWRSLVARFWRAGKIPLWNSYMFSGTPFLATLHSAALYPLNSLFFFLSDIDGWNMLAFLQIFLSAVFMYLFLQELNLAKESSLLGAVAFSFSGYMIAWLEFATGGHAAMWLPLLMFLQLKYLKSKKNIWLILIPLIFFFIYTAGDFQVPLYTTTTYIFFSIYLAFRKKSKIEKSKRITVFLKFCLGIIFGILLSLPQLLPAIELFTQSVRANDTYISNYFYGIAHWEKLANLIWPDFFGNVVTRNYWGKFGYHEYLAFAGVVTLVFATFSLFKKKKGHEVFFWILLLVSLLFLFPTPLAFLPYKLKLPGLGTSSASRIIFLVDFCLAVLAGYGFSKWQKEGMGVVKTVIFYLTVTAGIGLGLLVSIYIFTRDSHLPAPPILADLKVSLKNTIPSTFVLTILLFIFWIMNFFKNSGMLGKIKKLSVYLVIFLSIAELLRFAWKNTPFSPRQFLFPKTGTIEYLQNQQKPFRIAGGGIPLNYFMYYQLSSAEGYDPIYPLDNSKWLSAVNFSHTKNLSGRYGQIHNFSSPLINYANIGCVIDYQKNPAGEVSERGNYLTGIESSSFESVFSEGAVSVFKNKNVLPAVWLSSNFKVVSNREKIVDELSSKNAVAQKLILLEKDPLMTPENQPFNYEITNFSRGLNKIDFDVQSEKPTLVFLSETYYPGWKAQVDGQESEIFRANYLFQSIKIPQGKTHINFVYYPQSFKIGIRVAQSTLFLLIAFYLYDSKKISQRASRKRSS